MIFEIEKPISNQNYATLFIKYIVLFIVFFLLSWMIIPFIFSGRNPDNAESIAETLFDNPIISSVVIAIIVIGWFVYRTVKKFKYGEVYHINFNDAESKLHIKTVNLVNNSVKENQYDYRGLKFDFYTNEDPLFVCKEY